MNFRKCLWFLGVVGVCGAAVFLIVWRIHFMLTPRINPSLPDSGYFFATGETRKLLQEGRNDSWFAMPTLLHSLIFRYWPMRHAGMLPLNLCDQSRIEIGSPWFLWPVGGRAVIYSSDLNSNDQQRYLYLQSNPLIWFSALLATIVATSLAIARLFYWRAISLQRASLLYLPLGIYFSYLAIFASLSRQTFLHHYLVPLLISFIIVAVLIDEVKEVFGIPIKLETKRNLLFVWGLGVIAVFSFYSPLTYFMPISGKELQKRAILSVWDLVCDGCSRTNGFAELPPKIEAKHLKIGDVTASEIVEGAGPLRVGMTSSNRVMLIENRVFTSGFGVKTDSILKFPLEGAYSSLDIKVGIPDYEYSEDIGAVFQVIGDGKVLWESPALHRAQLYSGVVIVSQVLLLELRVIGVGSGHEYIDPCWIEPKLSDAGVLPEEFRSLTSIGGN